MSATVTTQDSNSLASPDWITEASASDITSMSIHWFRKKRVEGDGIPYSKIGRACRYRRADVIAWMESRKVRSTSETQSHS
jgi:predicted DNA-binding transcriptional regulator AlpA